MPMAEHHFQPEGYECIPNVIMLALHLAHVTEKPQALINPVRQSWLL